MVHGDIALDILHRQGRVASLHPAQQGDEHRRRFGLRQTITAGLPGTFCQAAFRHQFFQMLARGLHGTEAESGLDLAHRGSEASLKLFAHKAIHAFAGDPGFCL